MRIDLDGVLNQLFGFAEQRLFPALSGIVGAVDMATVDEVLAGLEHAQSEQALRDGTVHAFGAES